MANREKEVWQITGTKIDQVYQPWQPFQLKNRKTTFSHIHFTIRYLQFFFFHHWKLKHKVHISSAVHLFLCKSAMGVGCFGSHLHQTRTLCEFGGGVTKRHGAVVKWNLWRTPSRLRRPVSIKEPWPVKYARSWCKILCFFSQATAPSWQIRTRNQTVVLLYAVKALTSSSNFFLKQWS